MDKSIHSPNLFCQLRTFNLSFRKTITASSISAIQYIMCIVIRMYYANCTYCTYIQRKCIISIFMLTANRKYGSTIYNEHSSRSHTVFRILLSRKKEDHVCKMSILVSFCPSWSLLVQTCTYICNRNINIRRRERAKLGGIHVFIPGLKMGMVLMVAHFFMQPFL